MKDVTAYVDIKKCLELIQFCDYYKIASLGQLMEVLTYTPKKYKTFTFCYDNIDDVEFDDELAQVGKVKFWFDLLVNKEGFASLIKEYLDYKKATEYQIEST